MATITSIKGTDSLSASRVTLNDNFTALNDELALANALLDWDNANLSGMANVSSDAIDVTSAASFGASGNTLTADTDVDGLLKINKGATYDAETVAAMPAALAYEASTYFVTAPNAALAQGEIGQEITIIADGINVTVDASMIAGYSSVMLDAYGSVTLRYYNGMWYVVAASPMNTNLAI